MILKPREKVGMDFQAEGAAGAKLRLGLGAGMLGVEKRKGNLNH